VVQKGVHVLDLSVTGFKIAQLDFGKNEVADGNKVPGAVGDAIEDEFLVPGETVQGGGMSVGVGPEYVKRPYLKD